MPLGLDLQNLCGTVEEWFACSRIELPFCNAVDLFDDAEQTLRILQRQGVRPIAQRLIRIFMDFHEQRIDADGDSGPRQGGNVLALTAGSVAQAPREAASYEWRRKTTG